MEFPLQQTMKRPSNLPMLLQKLSSGNIATFTGNTCQRKTTVLVILLHLLRSGLSHRTLQQSFLKQGVLKI